MISLQRLNNAGLVALSLPSNHHFHPPFHVTNRGARRRHSLESLHLSTKTHQTHSASLSRQLSFLPEITNLCDIGSLTEASTLLQENLQNASLQTKQAIGMLLQACTHQKDIETGRKLHEIVSKSFLYSNDCVLNTRLITMYAICGSALDSRLVFDNLQRKNLFQWNALVSGYTRNGLFGDAINLFLELMADTELKPDNFTFPCVIKACVGILDAGLGEVIHGMMIKMGFVLDVFLGNALIAMYGNFGLVDEAVTVFDYMPVRNLISWNSMICGFSENGFSQDSLNMLTEMLMGEEAVLPDVATIVTILPVCARALEADMGMKIHGLAVKLGLSEEIMANNALVAMYSKCGYLPEAQMLFEKSKSKNVVFWNTMIGAFSTEGYICESFNLLRKMQMQGEIKADEVTVLNILPVCLETSQLRTLKELHSYSIRHGFQHNELVANATVAAYAKCGMLSLAERVFYSMETKSVSSWNALIGGYAQNGDLKRL